MSVQRDTVYFVLFHVIIVLHSRMCLCQSTVDDDQYIEQIRLSDMDSTSDALLNRVTHLSQTLNSQSMYLVQLQNMLQDQALRGATQDFEIDNLKATIDNLQLLKYGPPGVPGPVGGTGQRGPQGPQGVIGFLGPAGPVGATGYPGVIGGTGSTGMTGFPGATGAPGGAQGATGATGPLGGTGYTGMAGGTGAAGLTGARGEQGVPGDPGASGPPGV